MVFGEKLSFSLYYHLVKKQEYLYNKQIPHTSCLCEVHENMKLSAKGISKKTVDGAVQTNPHDIVEKYSCDSSQKEWMMGDDCPGCDDSNIVIQLLAQFSQSSFSESPNADGCKSSSDSSSDSSTERKQMINYQNWQTVNDRISKIKLSSTFEDAVDLFKDYVCTLKSTYSPTVFNSKSRATSNLHCRPLPSWFM